MPLKKFNSRSTPIFKNGLNIELIPVKDTKQPADVAKNKKNLPCASDMMMGIVEPVEVKYLESVELTEPRLDEQIREGQINLVRKLVLDISTMTSLASFVAGTRPPSPICPRSSQFLF
jgi:hypothetical protein